MGQIQSIGFKTAIADAHLDIPNFECRSIEVNAADEYCDGVQPLLFCGRAWYEYDNKGVKNRM